MKIKSNEIKIVDIDSVVPNPKNANQHSEAQIKRLSKLIKNTGFRSPLIVSNRSGFLIVGHCRLEAAKILKMDTVPVIFQDFKDEAEEFSFLVADNAIGSWSELDLKKISDETLNFPDFDVELLGMENFSIIEMATDEDDEQKEGESDKKLLLQVELPNELELRDLYDDLISKGCMVKEL